MGDQGQLWLFCPPESLATPFGLNAGLCSFGDHLLRSRQPPGARVCPSSPIFSSPSDPVRACSPAVRARLRTELGEIVPNAYHLAAPGRRRIPPGSAPLSTLPKARIAPHSRPAERFKRAQLGAVVAREGQRRYGHGLRIPRAWSSCSRDAD